MARAVTSDLQELLDKISIDTQTTLDIVPTVGDPVHVATDVFTTSKYTYSADLRQVDQIQQSIAQSTNRVLARIQNVDKVFGGSIYDEDWVGAEAVVGRFFRDEQTRAGSPNTGEWRELFRGTLVPYEIVEGEAVIEIVSDLTAAGFVVASTNLAENCQWVYKQSDTCGSASGEATCNKMRRSKGGCLGRGNEHRFGGMEFPDPQVPAPPTGPIIGPGPSDPEYPSCPRWNQYVLVRGEDEFSRVLRRARDVRVGNWVWHPVLRRWDRVTVVQVVPDQEIWEAVSANGGRGESSGSHPLIADETDTDGLAIRKCKAGRDQLTWSNRQLVPSRLESVRKTGERDNVIRIETAHFHVFCYGSTPETLLVGHNSIKPIE